MMAYMASSLVDIDRMPRGGPDASCLDRRLQTDRREISTATTSMIASSAVWSALWSGPASSSETTRSSHTLRSTKWPMCPIPTFWSSARGMAVCRTSCWKPIPPPPSPSPTSNASSVDGIAAGDLGGHPRAAVREMDATAIDAPDGYFDLAVFALSFHHLPPPLASLCLRRGHPCGGQAAGHRPPAAAVAAAPAAVDDDAAVGPAGAVRAQRGDQLVAQL